MQANVKIKNGKNLKVKTLVDSECTHMKINKQLVKDKRLQMRLINFSFEAFDIDKTKNREMTRMIPLEIEINEYKKQLKAVVTDLMEWTCFWDTTGWSSIIQKSTRRTEQYSSQDAQGYAK